MTNYSARNKYALLQIIQIIAILQKNVASLKTIERFEAYFNLANFTLFLFIILYITFYI